MNSHEDSFSSAEHRIAVTQRRLPEVPLDYIATTRLIGHIHKRSQTLANSILKQFALNMPTYNTLMMLFGTEDSRLSVSELADATGEKRSNMTRICDELIEMKLIDRFPSLDDRRAIIVSLTREGQSLIEKLVPTLNKMLTAIYADFSAAELRQLQRMLRRQLAGLERYEMNSVEAGT